MIVQSAFCAFALMAAGAAQSQVVDCAMAETQNDMNHCAEKDWQDADTVLNAAYANAMILMNNIDADLAQLAQTY